MGYDYAHLMDAANELMNQAVSMALLQFLSNGGSGGGNDAGVAEYEETKRLQKEFGDIPSLFQPYSTLPDPIRYQGMISDLTRALSMLCMDAQAKDPIDGTAVWADPRLGSMDLVQTWLSEHWTGPAANTFEATFTAPFKAHTSNQFVLCALVKSSLEAYRDLWTAARKDITDLVNNALVAVEHASSTLCSSNQWTMTWTIAIAVVGVIDAPLGGLEAYALASIGGAFSIAQVSYTPPDNQFGGHAVEDMVNGIRDAVHTYWTKLQAEEQKIVTALGMLGAAAADRSLFVAPTPQFVGATPGNIRTLLGDGA